MKHIVASFLFFVSTIATASTWQNIEFYNKSAIPIKFVNGNKPGKSTTVLFVHGTNGPDYRAEYWSSEFAAVGINTLIVDFKRNRFTGPRDRDRVFFVELINHTVAWLKEHPNVDHNNIIFMGISLGGYLGFRMYGSNDFSKYVLLYPVCHSLLKPENQYMIERKRYHPTLLIWGEEDSYEEKTYCPQVVSKLTGSISWIAIPKAGHGFDGNLTITFRDHASPSGIASLTPNVSAARIARNSVINFVLEK